MNRVTISGNLTRDPELVTTSGGVEMAKFGVAVIENRKVGDEWVEKAHFVDVTYFGKRAATMTAKANKGDKVFVDGRLDFQKWETDDGKRTKLEVVANEVEGEFQFRKAGTSRADAPAELPADPAPSVGTTGDDADIPF